MKFKTRPYPRVWEVSLSKVLGLLLPPAQLVAIVYAVFLMCETPVKWPQVGILLLITIAIQKAHTNVKGILTVVKDDNDSSRE
jgi:hypothetical protein